MRKLSGRIDATEVPRQLELFSDLDGSARECSLGQVPERAGESACVEETLVMLAAVGLEIDVHAIAVLGLGEAPDGGRVGDVAVEYKLNFMAPARGDHLEAVGTVVRPCRTLTVYRLDVWAVDSDQRTLIATGQQTLLRAGQ